MPNALTIFDAGAMPAHIATANEDANIVPRASVNSLTFEGKTWSISLDGKKTKLLKTNADGEEEPVTVFTGVLLDYTKVRGREYYAGAYDPKKPAIPDCWSEDSVKPVKEATHKQALACADCPMSKKGSQTTAAGLQTVACGQTKKLAIVPTAKLGAFPPLRLKIKITSIYDKSGAEKNAATGWYAFDQYIDLLVSKGVRHTALLPTKIKFDTSVAYPKLLFSPGKDWLTEEQLDIVKPMAASDEVKELLASSYTPTEGKGKALPADNGEETEVEAGEMPAQAKPASKAKAAPVIADDDDDKPIAVNTKAPKATPAKAAPVVAADDEGEDEDEKAMREAQARIAAKKAAAKAAAEAAAAADEDEPDAEATAKAARLAAKKATEKAAEAAQVKAATKAAATRAAATTADDEVEDETTVLPPKAAKAAAATAGKAKATPAAAPLAAPKEVADMLAEWDE